MAKVYHESVMIDRGGKPFRYTKDGKRTNRGAMSPVGGIWYWNGSKEWKEARKKLKKMDKAKAQWKANAEAEAAGEFVPIPGVFPVAMQLDLYEEGKWKSTFWQELWEGFDDDQ